MIRIVLVEWEIGEWRLYRQPQWMAQVRESPEVATRPRLHFDILEAAYAAVLQQWAGAATDRESALAMLSKHGAVEVVRK